MLEPEQPLLLVLDRDSQLPEVLRHFARTGFERFAGYLAGGMSRRAAPKANSGVHSTEDAQ